MYGDDVRSWEKGSMSRRREIFSATIFARSIRLDARSLFRLGERYFQGVRATYKHTSVHEADYERGNALLVLEPAGAATSEQEAHNSPAQSEERALARAFTLSRGIVGDRCCLLLEYDVTSYSTTQKANYPLYGPGERCPLLHLQSWGAVGGSSAQDLVFLGLFGERLGCLLPYKTSSSKRALLLFSLPNRNEVWLPFGSGRFDLLRGSSGGSLINLRQNILRFVGLDSSKIKQCSQSGETTDCLFASTSSSLTLRNPINDTDHDPILLSSATASGAAVFLIEGQCPSSTGGAAPCYGIAVSSRTSGTLSFADQTLSGQTYTGMACYDEADASKILCWAVPIAANSNTAPRKTLVLEITGTTGAPTATIQTNVALDGNTFEEGGIEAVVTPQEGGGASLVYHRIHHRAAQGPEYEVPVLSAEQKETLFRSTMPTAVDIKQKRLFLTDPQRVEIFGVDGAASSSMRVDTVDLRSVFGDKFRNDRIKGIANVGDYLLVAHSGMDASVALDDEDFDGYMHAKISLFAFEKYHVALQRSPPLAELQQPLPVVRSGLQIIKNSRRRLEHEQLEQVEFPVTFPRNLEQTAIQSGNKRGYGTDKWKGHFDFIQGRGVFNQAEFEKSFEQLKVVLVCRQDHYRLKRHDLVFAMNERALLNLDVFDVAVKHTPTFTTLLDILGTDNVFDNNISPLGNYTAYELGFRVASIVVVEGASVPTQGVFSAGQTPANATVAAHHSYLVVSAVCKEDNEIVAPDPVVQGGAAIGTCAGRSRIYLLSVDAAATSAPSSIVLHKAVLPVRALRLAAREGATKETGASPFLIVFWSESTRYFGGGMFWSEEDSSGRTLIWQFTVLPGPNSRVQMMNNVHNKPLPIQWTGFLSDDRVACLTHWEVTFFKVDKLFRMSRQVILDRANGVGQYHYNITGNIHPLHFLYPVPYASSSLISTCFFSSSPHNSDFSDHITLYVNLPTGISLGHV